MKVLWLPNQIFLLRCRSTQTQWLTKKIGPRNLANQMEKLHSRTQLSWPQRLFNFIWKRGNYLVRENSIFYSIDWSKATDSMGFSVYRSSPKYLARFTDNLAKVKPDGTHWAVAAVPQHQLHRTENDMVSLFSEKNPRLLSFIWPILPLIKLVIFSLTLELLFKRVGSCFVSSCKTTDW